MADDKDKAEEKFKQSVATVNKSIADLNKKFEPARIILGDAFDELKPKIDAIHKALINSIEFWESNNQAEFNATLETVKHYLQSRGMVLPLNWREVYLDWLIEQHIPDDDLENLNTIENLGMPPENFKGRGLKYGDLISLNNIPFRRDFIIRWSESYTREMDTKRQRKPSNKAKPQKPIRNDLKALFEAEGKGARWNEICHILSRQGVFDSQLKTWLKPANQLAGTIRVIETRELTLSKKLSIPEIVTIAKKNFGKVINTENVRGETAEKWNWIDLEN